VLDQRVVGPPLLVLICSLGEGVAFVVILSVYKRVVSRSPKGRRSFPKLISTMTPTRRGSSEARSLPGGTVLIARGNLFNLSLKTTTA
jgi:hypothetical protein